jgi:DNA repair protein RecO (recombination protein O)
LFPFRADEYQPSSTLINLHQPSSTFINNLFMLLKTRGIVFRTVKYGETSVIADIFTEEKGLHSFIAGSVRAAKARMPYNLFQPMTVVELVSYFRDDVHALNRLKELRAAEVWSKIPFDIRRGAVALFMAEVCKKCIQQGSEDRDLLQFLLDNLRWLDSTPNPIANLHLHFLLQLSGFLGFQPQGDSDIQMPVFFDAKEGVFVETEPLHNDSLGAVQSAQMLALLHLPLEQCHEVKMTRADRKTMLQKLLQFYQLHVPGLTGINTPEILEMILE